MTKGYAELMMKKSGVIRGGRRHVARYVRVGAMMVRIEYRIYSHDRTIAAGIFESSQGRA